MPTNGTISDLIKYKEYLPRGFLDQLPTRVKDKLPSSFWNDIVRIDTAMRDEIWSNLPTELKDEFGDSLPEELSLSKLIDMRDYIPRSFWSQLPT